MAATFTGSFEQLQEALRSIGAEGEWSEGANDSKCFRSRDGVVVTWYPGRGTLMFQGKQVPRDELQRRLLEATDQPLPIRDAAPVRAAAEDRPRVFVVHGHDQTAREQLELVLHKLGLDPFVLANTGGGGLTIIEALENEIGRGPSHVRFGIVLMTPDDVGYAKSAGADAAQPRARQNVVLEMGMLIAALGRPNVAILKRGHIEVPSDAQGILYIPFNDHVRETVPKLVDRLRAAGFDLDASKISRAIA